MDKLRKETYEKNYTQNKELADRQARRLYQRGIWSFVQNPNRITKENNAGVGKDRTGDMPQEQRYIL